MTLDEINKRAKSVDGTASLLRYYPSEFEIVLAQLLERFVITLEKAESRAAAEYDAKFVDTPF